MEVKAGLATGDRCNAGELSEHSRASVRGRLEAQLGRLIDGPPQFAAAERFTGHLVTEFPAVSLGTLSGVVATATGPLAHHPLEFIREPSGELADYAHRIVGQSSRLLARPDPRSHPDAAPRFAERCGAARGPRGGRCQLVHRL